MSTSDANGPAQPASNRLRLYTHNIWGTRGDWDARRKVLRDGISQRQPDLITLQETLVTDQYDQVADLLGSGYHIAHSRERGEDMVGISIASRWPIVDLHEPDLKLTSRTGDFACTAMIAEIDAPGPLGPLLLANHFPDYQVDHEHERELQPLLSRGTLRISLGSARGTFCSLVISMQSRIAASMRFLTGKQSLDGLSVCYRNAWGSAHPGEEGGTYVESNPLAPEDWPFARIDHILVRCGAQGGPTLDVAAFDQPVEGVWASDHFGLVADFTAKSQVDQQ